jgi:hypothetical protein
MPSKVLSLAIAKKRDETVTQFPVLPIKHDGLMERQSGQMLCSHLPEQDKPLPLMSSFDSSFSREYSRMKPIL